MERHDTADARPLYQPNDFIALEMAILAAKRLDPERLAAFHRDLLRLHPGSRKTQYVTWWEQAIAQGPDAVRSILVEPSQRGQVMRSVVSFRAFVTKRERDEIFTRHLRAGTR